MAKQQQAPAAILTARIFTLKIDAPEVIQRAAGKISVVQGDLLTRINYVKPRSSKWEATVVPNAALIASYAGEGYGAALISGVASEYDAFQTTVSEDQITDLGNGLLGFSDTTGSYYTVRAELVRFYDYEVGGVAEEEEAAPAKATKAAKGGKAAAAAEEVVEEAPAAPAKAAKGGKAAAAAPTKGGKGGKGAAAASSGWGE